MRSHGKFAEAPPALFRLVLAPFTSQPLLPLSNQSEILKKNPAHIINKVRRNIFTLIYFQEINFLTLKVIEIIATVVGQMK